MDLLDLKVPLNGAKKPRNKKRSQEGEGLLMSDERLKTRRASAANMKLDMKKSRVQRAIWLACRVLKHFSKTHEAINLSHLMKFRGTCILLVKFDSQ